MAGHHRGEGIEFEVKIGMAGSDHFMVDKFFSSAQMTFEAEAGTVDDIARIFHAERDGFFVGPVAGGMRT